ncbi:hypothetical protein SRHO_G00201910 [Serrasalmus rhombeus]
MARCSMRRTGCTETILHEIPTVGAAVVPEDNDAMEVPGFQEVTIVYLLGSSSVASTGPAPDLPQPSGGSRIGQDWTMERRAGELTGRAGQHQKHDNQGLLGLLMVGERVLVRNVGPKGQGKLANFWSSMPDVVTKQPNLDIPVYVVMPEKGSGKERVLHRKLLRPCPLSLQDSGEEAAAAADGPGPSTQAAGAAGPPTPWLFPPTWFLPPLTTCTPSAQPSTEDGVAPDAEGPRRSHGTTKGIPPERYGDA